MSEKGIEITSYYESENMLNAIIRKRLICLVVDYFVTNRIKLGTKDCNLLADKIVKLFPTEQKVSFFVSTINLVNLF